ncbi:MAG: hypothetical protein OJF60_002012 [Burkholderiaceae bacterium]|nr:MAG: hypothetical protein OJF60_002012 [Burkholderiaceae bacterium]
MNHPQAARTSCRFASPLQGGTASGRAEPAPRRLLARPAPRPFAPLRFMCRGPRNAR